MFRTVRFRHWLCGHVSTRSRERCRTRCYLVLAGCVPALGLLLSSELQRDVVVHCPAEQRSRHIWIAVAGHPHGALDPQEPRQELELAPVEGLAPNRRSEWRALLVEPLQHLQARSVVERAPEALLVDIAPRAAMLACVLDDCGVAVPCCGDAYIRTFDFAQLRPGQGWS